MAEVAKIDDRGRMRLPKGTAKNSSSVVIIDSGAYFLCIPFRETSFRLPLRG
jgi:hypothetical protein